MIQIAHDEDEAYIADIGRGAIIPADNCTQIVRRVYRIRGDLSFDLIKSLTSSLVKPLNSVVEH